MKNSLCYQTSGRNKQTGGKLENNSVTVSPLVKQVKITLTGPSIVLENFTNSIQLLDTVKLTKVHFPNI